MRQAIKLAIEWIEKQPEETPHTKYDVDTRYVVLRELEAALAQEQEHDSAIKTLKHLKYTYHGGEYWKPPLGELKALAQPEQEPVAFEAFNAWMHYNLPVGTVIGHSGWWADKIYSRFMKNTTPPQRKPLMLEQLFKLWEEDTSCDMPDTFKQFKHTARAIEAAHGIKE